MARKITENRWEFSIRLADTLCVMTLDIDADDCTAAQRADLFRKLKYLQEEVI